MKSMIKFIGGIIRSFDSFPSPVSLLIKGESDVKNAFGGFVSLITLFLSIFLSADSFFDYWNSTNPTTVTNTEYNVESSLFNLTTFFMSVSFFSPLNDSIKVDNKFNDRQSIYYLNNLTYLCTNCSSNDNSTTASTDEFDFSKKLMNLCTEASFNNITIRGMSSSKSEGILTIFKNYSYCFPDSIDASILNSIDSNSPDAPEASIQIYIPKLNTSVDFSTVPKNTKTPESFLPRTPQTQLSVVIKTKQPEPAAAPASEPAPATANTQHQTQSPSPNGGSTSSSQQPQQTGGTSTQKPGSGTSQPLQSQVSGPNTSPTSSPTSTPSITLTKSSTSSPTSTPTTTPTKSSTSSPTSTPTTTSTKSSTSSPTTTPTKSSTSSPTSIPTTSSTNSPTSTPTSTTSTSPILSPILSTTSTTTTSPTSTSTTTTSPTSTTTTSSTSLTSSPTISLTSTLTTTTSTTTTSLSSGLTSSLSFPKLRNLEEIFYTNDASTTTAMQETQPSISSDLTDDFKNEIKKVSSQEMTQRFKKLKFPKILILHKKIEINTDEQIEKLFSERHFLEILDYNDQLLNTKIVYDIHIKQVRITQQQNGLLFPWSQEKVFLVIDRIEKNTLDTLNVDVGYFSLKLDNDGYSITISYTGLPDFLGVFGSFYATFTLFASLITSYPAGIIYNQTMINQIFRFVEDRVAKRSKDMEKTKGKGKDKNKNNEEDMQKDFDVGTRSFKFKKFEDLSVNQISQLYRKNLNDSKPGLKDNNEFSRSNSKKSLGNNKSMNSTFNLIPDPKNKLVDRGNFMLLNEKQKNKGKDIELEVINVNDKNVSCSYNSGELTNQKLKTNNNECENLDEKKTYIDSSRELINESNKNEKNAKLENDLKDKSDCKLNSTKNPNEEEEKNESDILQNETKGNENLVTSIMLLKKLKERINDENEKLFDMYVKRISHSNEIKKKSLKKRKISICDMLRMQVCSRFKKDKHKILDKCQEFIDTTLNVNYIINKLFEINFMKSILFTAKQHMVFDYQNKKFINLSHLTKAEDYLESLNDFAEDHKFDFEKYEEAKSSCYGIREKLLIAMKNRFLSENV